MIHICALWRGGSSATDQQVRRALREVRHNLPQLQASLLKAAASWPGCGKRPHAGGHGHNQAWRRRGGLTMTMMVTSTASLAHNDDGPEQRVDAHNASKLLLHRFHQEAAACSVVEKGGPGEWSAG